MSFQDVYTDGSRAAARQPYRELKQDPSQAVAAGVFKMNTQVSNFKRLIHTLGTPKDTPELREKLRKMRVELQESAKETGGKLKAAQEADHRDSADKSKKLSDAKLAKDFEAVLREFQTAQRNAAERETLFAPLLPANKENGALDLELGRSQTQNPQQRRQEMMLVENELVYNEAVIDERDQGIREIQRQIGEVNEIFKDLAVLVKEQGHAVDDLEANIESSHANTLVANKNLVSAVRRQQGANKITCWITVVFAVAIFIFFLVLSS
jgi:syntaxin 7